MKNIKIKSKSKIIKKFFESIVNNPKLKDWNYDILELEAEKLYKKNGSKYF